MKTETKVARGGTIRQETSPDREKPIKGISSKEALTGRPMGGSPTKMGGISGGGKVETHRGRGDD